ncbi:MAG: ChaN family lipoprotein [Sulfitobacter sp.]|nr:ChaN family lipoprotein [Sulfitobacter sp.]
MQRGLALLFGLLVAGTVTAQSQAQDLTSAQTAAMLSADIVILGEIHDNGAHHAGQARLMAKIAPKAVVFEMLTPQMAGVVNISGRSEMRALDDAIGWGAAGWPDIALYQPVFEALGDATVIGAAAPRDTVRAAFAQGAAAVFGADAARFGLANPLPAAQQEARRVLQFEAHCQAMPLEMMDGIIEAQRLRDAQFSAAALRALADHGAPVVVITGNGHARRDWAMPFVIAQAAPDVATYSIGFVEAPSDADDPRFDATIITKAAPRDDPCAAFSK